MIELDPELLAREGHGAVQVDLPVAEPLVLMLAGPIKIWWDEGMWGSPAHHRYTEWRDAVRVACVREGFLIFSPHRAWQGAWTESAQRVNDMAIEMADVLIDLTPPGILANGTLTEIAHANRVGTPVLSLPPGDGSAIGEAIDLLRKFGPRRADPTL
jgi:hypothetical protein